MASDAAYAFLDTYTRDGGRIARLDEGGDTVGEGQAYALLAAAALGDGERFERIWAWTRANVQRPDGLLVFRWADGAVVDPQPASDADLDLAHALLVAACRFDRPDLREEAERVGRAVLESQTATAAGRRVLLAGPWAARDDGLVVNPSYLDPLTLTALQDVTGDARYGEVADAGRAHVGALSDPLPPDWAVVDPDTGDARPVAGPDDREGTPRFSFDAPRTLVRMAVDPSAEGRAVAARAWPAFARTAPEDLRVEHALDGEPAGDSRSPVTLVAAAGAAQAAGDRDASARLLAGADRLAREHPTYYGAAWVALGRLMLTTPRLRPCAAG
jgi:endoglucanase